MSAYLDPQPFRDWYAEQKKRFTPEEIARWFGVDSRTLRRWDEGSMRIRRAELEDAVMRSHFSLWDIYPELENEPVDELAERRETRRRSDARITDDQLRILNAIHVERGVSIRELGRQIWEQVGCSSPGAADSAIRRGFKRLHLPIEKRIVHHPSSRPRCADVARRTGERCRLPVLEGEDFCWTHHPDTREQAKAYGIENSPFTKAAA